MALANPLKVTEAFGALVAGGKQPLGRLERFPITELSCNIDMIGSTGALMFRIYRVH